MKLYISEPESRESGAILVCDEDHNDIAEFYHNEHATVSQSYETALMLARKLVEGADLGDVDHPMTDPRFFIDHSMIHDRETGKHVTTEPDSPFRRLENRQRLS